MQNDTNDAAFSMELYEAIQERNLKYQSEAWGFAAAYDAAITVGGYAAFFALWSGVSEDVTQATRATTAALLGFSLLLYIGWNLAQMLFRHHYDKQLAAVAMKKGQDAATSLAAWQQIDAKRNEAVLRFQHRYWRPVFGTAVATGVGGGMLLTYNCIAIATGLPQFPT